MLLVYLYLSDHGFVLIAIYCSCPVQAPCPIGQELTTRPGQNVSPDTEQDSGLGRWQEAQEADGEDCHHEEKGTRTAGGF